jgi:hypothetical protein
MISRFDKLEEYMAGSKTVVHLGAGGENPITISERVDGSVRIKAGEAAVELDATDVKAVAHHLLAIAERK